MKALLRTTFLTTVLIVQGCATIVSGRDQEVTFQSTPDGATVKVNGRPLGKTPLTINIKRAEGQTLTFEREGYKPMTTELTTSLEPWFWGNLIFGLDGLFSSTTDKVTGAMDEYSPSQYFVSLTPTGSSDGMLSEIQQVKRYVVVNFEELKKDASTGEEGDETFVSLLKLLDIDKSDHKDIGKLDEILKGGGDSIKAGSSVAGEFVQ